MHRHVLVLGDQLARGVGPRAAASFDADIEAYLNQFRGVTLTVMEPNDHGWSEHLTASVERHGGSLDVVEPRHDPPETVRFEPRLVHGPRSSTIPAWAW